MLYEFQVSLYKNRLFPVIIPDSEILYPDQLIVVDTGDGQEVGKVSRIPRVVQPAWNGKSSPKTVTFVRMVTEEDKKSLAEKQVQESEALEKCKTLIEQHNLSMQLISAYYTFDRRKITFFFTSPQRVDFRGLLKDLIQVIRRVRINLRQIGARDEVAMHGGIGMCGRELCCASWLRDFKPVNISLAKDQNLPLNPQKVTGNCGRLLCCLNYEYEAYLQVAQKMPPLGRGVRIPNGDKGLIISINFLKEEAVIKFENGNVKSFKPSEIEILPENETVNVAFEIQSVIIKDKVPMEDLSILSE